DRGTPAAPALTTEARVVLHARRRRAALFDDSAGAAVMEVSTLRRDRRVCAQLEAGGYLRFNDVNLQGIAQIACEVSAGAGHGGTLEFRAGRPDGPLLGAVEVPETGRWEDWRTVTAAVRDPGGVQDLYVVARGAPGRAAKRLNLDVLEFVAAAGQNVSAR
ncbi:MAG: carbohydrate-binding protein, partial [Opitutaceae bacterium]|nr:carbohydrate-binding protein [Opitutaceae bacterium]